MLAILHNTCICKNRILTNQDYIAYSVENKYSYNESCINEIIICDTCSNISHFEQI